MRKHPVADLKADSTKNHEAGNGKLSDRGLQMMVD